MYQYVQYINAFPLGLVHIGGVIMTDNVFTLMYLIGQDYPNFMMVNVQIHSSYRISALVKTLP